MRKKLLIFILFLALLLIIAKIVTTNDIKQEASITASYSEQTGYITVNVDRPSNKHKSYEYEIRPGGDEIISLSDHYTEGSTDIFVFEIIGNGNTELALYSIDPQETRDGYKTAFPLKIVVTDDVIDLNNKLWRRN
jgi:hypothetical protein